MAEQGESENKKSVKCSKSATPGNPLNHVGARFREGVDKNNPIDVLISQASTLNLESLVTNLESKKSLGLPVYIHLSCRTSLKNASRPKRKTETDGSETVKRTVRRSEVEQFDFLIHCFYCGLECVKDERHPKRSQEFCVATFKDCNMLSSTLGLCSGRTDELAKIVE